MKKMLKIIILILILLFVTLVIYFIFGRGPKRKKIIWGVNFSQMHTENLKLDWKKTYSAIIGDLGVKYIKLITSWDWINGNKDDYFFDDVDWQVKKAEENNVKIIMVIGMKTGRWPECHIPSWAENLPKEQRETEILKYLEKIVQRYKNSPSLIAWQVENEPFFPFGKCPKVDINFLKKEVELVKSLDPHTKQEWSCEGGENGEVDSCYGVGVNDTRPVIVSDTGEFSLWLKAAKIGDIVGTTMYKKVWLDSFNTYFYAPFPPLFYWWKARLVKALYGKKVDCVELQAEPWGSVLLYNLSLEEQKKTMDLEKFKYNIEFAEKTGLDTFYLWGSEWWYWMKEKQNQPEIWNEAKKLFQ